MPVITNFGDVTTVGNAAVNGTGTSSFAGPVTFAQGAGVTGSVSVTTSFFGVLSGQNTAAVSTLTATTNVYAPVVTTPISNAATSIATTGFYGALVGLNTAAVTVLTASANVNAPTMNVQTLNVSTQANVTFLNVSQTAFLSNANVLTANITSSNVLTENVTTLNVSGLATLLQANILTANITSSNVLTENVSTLNVSGLATLFSANVLTGNITSANVLTGNVTYLNVSQTAFLSSANVLTGNITSANVLTGNVTYLNVSQTAFLSSANILTGNITAANIVSLNVTGDANIAQNLKLKNNLYASNIIMSSNLSTNTGYGNVYLTGNLVVQGNIYSIGGSVGSGSGTSQGILYSLGSNYVLPAAFATGTAGPGLSGYHVNMASFQAEAVASVSAFTASSGMLKFATGGLYQVTCVIVGDQPVSKIAIGKTSSSSFPPSVTATAGYDYVYNYPVGSSPSEMVTIPLTVLDTSQYYYLDVFFSTAGGTPTVLYPTRSTTAAGATFGTYVQVGPFGNYLTSATGVASGLLMNCYGTTTLSSPVTSNTFRLAMTTANGWTVNGVSTSLAVTSGGNIQVNQAGIYEVSLCLNPTSGGAPLLFGVGSLSTDGAPTAQGPYLYQYAPMYTQDPTTVVSLPLNITDTSKYYYLDVIFPGSQATVGLSNVSTFVSVKPVGSYVSPSTNPWRQQGSSVYYNSGPVGLGMNPSALTETLTVSGNTSFVGNVTVTSDVSGATYVTGKRTPAGSLSVANYVTGSVPLTTTTNLIQNYLSNAAAVVTNAPTYNPALSLPKTATSYSNLTPFHSAHVNTTTSNIFVEAWVYITANTGATQGIFSVSNVASDESGLYINSTGQIVAYETNSTGTAVSVNAATNLINATWTHIAFSFNATGASKVVTVFKNGTAASSGALSGTTRYNTTHSVYIGGAAFSGWEFGGYIYDMRVLSGSIVPTASFTAPATPAVFGLTAPSYVTNMNLGGSANVALSLQSQYFPGASTSPYGPCLTLPGTVGSYYSAVNTAYDTNWKINGFCLEAWVNYASLANSNLYNTASYPYMIGHMFPAGPSGSFDYAFGPTTTGQISMYWNTGAAAQALVSANTITTGQWTHLMVQSNGSNVYMAINGTFTTLSGTGQNYSPSGGNGTVAPSAPPTVTITSGCPLTVGAYFGNPCPNFAIAKARLVFGTSGNPALGNVYSSGNFTANPNFAAVPAGATVAWSLDSQYALPTYPSIQDVTELPQQASSYGSLPTPIGGVTSNVVGPFGSSYPQLNSIRFDGTGYIDYGNAASSVLTTNLWANAWTIEGWVYVTSYTASAQIILSRTLNPYFDFAFYVTGYLMPGIQWSNSTTTINNRANSGSSNLVLYSWTHVAVTFDGTNSNVYFGGTLSNSMVVSSSTMWYTPNHHIEIGSWLEGAYYNLNGNLADLRVSNVARYGGTTYVVPTAPFATDANTLLLLKSLGGQPATTLEVQGRGLNAVSLGAGRTTYSYPPAPMSSYLLDTTSNASVTYGQGKYVASASSEYGTSSLAWYAFDGNNATVWAPANPSTVYVNGLYVGSVTTVDTLGTSYPGEWLQIQMPVSIILSSYTLINFAGYFVNNFSVLGSRDGVNWTLVNRQINAPSGTTTSYNVSVTQAYSYFRFIAYGMVSTAVGACPNIYTWTLNGTEESLCVTSDSKVGVGIANPQRTMEIAGDLVVSGTISGGAGMGSFRNRIINGDMRIAQRGTSNVLAATGSDVKNYMIDRFFAQSNFSTASGITQYQTALAASDTPYQLGLRNYMNVFVNIGSSVTALLPISQVLEGYNIQDLNWGTSFGSPVTLSFWFRTNAPAGSQFTYSLLCFTPGTPSWAGTFVPIPGVWQYWTFTVPPPPNGSSWSTGSTGALAVYVAPYYPGGFTSTVNAWNSGSFTYCSSGSYNWPALAGNYIHCTGIQLERGTVASPFEVRPYATELALCQRYYQKTYNMGTAPGTNVAGVGAIVVTASSSTIVPGVQFRATMRAAPTIVMYNPYSTTSGVIGIYSNGYDTGAATVDVGTTGDSGFRYVAVTVTSGVIYQYHYTANAEL